MADIDMDHIESLGGFGSHELVEILGDFLDGLDAQAAELVSRLKSEDREGFRESAHRFKGGAQMSGFPALGDLASSWEKLALAGQPLPEIPELETQLSVAIGAAQTAFQDAAKEQKAS